MKIVGLILLLWALLAPATAQNPAEPAAPAAQVPQAAPASDDALTQMRDDLNRLESLNLNMSSEIEFLRDQNLQILLRTNSQMWTVLIRDLRRQIDREEQRRATRPPAEQHPPAKRPDDR
ncbi:MAG TPA: hypothetical protein VFB04_11760 [Terriglobales bacterium]|nr:hypothetical protein [Terriglobales bacterium]